ncbi:MAG TPA: methyltransferase domain-containing protein [Acidimicrobiales bacterium]|nr:methyltransferase domain-containing protein [Acidimicrobiales bacterium]
MIDSPAPATGPPSAPIVAGQKFNAARPEVHARDAWSQYSYVSARLRDQIGSFLAQAGVAPGGRVLDFGCATKPYADLVPAGVELIGADLEGNPDADWAIDATGRIEAPDASVDVVLSTQVLEHVPSPGRYLAEARRVLRPGGALILTTHGLMYFHRDPEDYWRWTCDGLTKIVEEQGFEVERLEGLLGLAPTALQLFQDATCQHLPRKLWRPYLLAFQKAIAWSDRRYSDQSRRENALVLGVLARRAVGEPAGAGPDLAGGVS